MRPSAGGTARCHRRQDIADYDMDIGYEGSEPKVEPTAQIQNEVDPDAEYAKMEISHDGTLHQRMMPGE